MVVPWASVYASLRLGATALSVLAVSLRPVLSALAVPAFLVSEVSACDGKLVAVHLWLRNGIINVYMEYSTGQLHACIAGASRQQLTRLGSYLSVTLSRGCPLDPLRLCCSVAMSLTSRTTTCSRTSQHPDRACRRNCSLAIFGDLKPPAWLQIRSRFGCACELVGEGHEALQRIGEAPPVKQLRCRHKSCRLLAMRRLSTADLCSCMQLSYGLSTEYSNKPTSEGKEKVDADRDVFAKYYVNQILEMGEEGIRDAWHKASLLAGESHVMPRVKLDQTLMMSEEGMRNVWHKLRRRWCRRPGGSGC